ncbi:MAG: nucleotidyltransferase substrate binding protein [Balneolaceae bacterium]
MATELNTEPLEKAFHSLEIALAITPHDEIVRDATIQRFEYSFELSWKFMKRYLKEFAGIEEHQIKEIFRNSAKIGLINNPENWIGYHKARNLTSHTYNEKIAEETYRFAISFSGDANYFLKQLKQRLK